MGPRSLTIDRLAPRSFRLRARAARVSEDPSNTVVSPLSRLILRLLVACLGAAVGGCHDGQETYSAPPSSPAPAVPPGTQGEASRDTLLGEFRPVELQAVPARVRLPDPRSWRASREGTFVVLEQRSTSSRVVLRVWKAARLVRPAECEAEARLARPTLPRPEPTTVLDERPITAPEGYDVRLVVAVEEGPRRSVHGYALAVGAAIGRCYLGSYETWAEGPSAPEHVADRLAAMVPGFIETLRVEGAEVRANRTDTPD